MGQDFFKNLPSEIIIDILSGLPVPTIIGCKCVCRSWLNLLDTSEFGQIHLSKSIPGLAAHRHGLTTCKIFEFEDRLDLKRHELHYNPITKSNLPYLMSRFDPNSQGLIECSITGLFFVRYNCFRSDALVICNPITRDYIELDCPQDLLYEYNQMVTYGFGVSKMSCQHKVVRVFNDFIFDDVTREPLRISKSECHVYTLGTGLWRRIELGAQLGCSWRTFGAFLNGNLHWLVDDLNGSKWISCFDLETEVFNTFSAPSLPEHEEHIAGVSAFGDYLCLCDNSYDEEIIVIWLMKKYGDEKSWTKEFVIKQDPYFLGDYLKVVYPMKLFKDGDMLMAWQFFPFIYDQKILVLYDQKIPVYYSNKTKTIKVMNMPELPSVSMSKLDDVDSVILHTSSFLSLKSFANENARSFK